MLKYIALIFFILVSGALGQILQEMAVEEIPAGEGLPYVIRDARKAILIVHSQMAVMSFASNMGIIKVDNPDLGEYIIHLLPGTHIITFKADGFSPNKQRFNILPKCYREVRITPKEIIPDKLPVTIRVTPKPDQVKIDGEVIDISQSNKLDVGEHRIEVEKEGYEGITENLYIDRNQIFFDYKLKRIVDIDSEIMRKFEDHSKIDTSKSYEKQIRYPLDKYSEISGTIGFYLGHSYSLFGIGEKFPELFPTVYRLENQFDKKYLLSLQHIDCLMNNKINAWKMLKQEIIANFDVFCIDNISKDEAISYLDTVRARINGDIPDHILYPLLIFHPIYLDNPEREIQDGFIKRFETDGTGKSNGLIISLEYPKTWQGKRAERPHVLKKFISQNGNGMEQFLVSVHPNPAHRYITKETILEMINSGEVTDYVPEGARYTDYGYYQKDSFLGFWVKYSFTQHNGVITINSDVIQYYFFVKGNFLGLMFFFNNQVIIGENIEKNENEIKKFLPLYRKIANSLVIYNKYLDNESIQDKEYQLLKYEVMTEIIISIILTWGFGLLIPILLRFVILKKTLSKPISIIVVIVLFFLNVIIFTALGSESKTHGALI